MIRFSLPLLFTFILAAAVAYFAYSLFGWIGVFIAAFPLAAIIVATIKRELSQSQP